jgi:hypothetical protein
MTITSHSKTLQVRASDTQFWNLTGQELVILPP